MHQYDWIEDTFLHTEILLGLDLLQYTQLNMKLEFKTIIKIIDYFSIPIIEHIPLLLSHYKNKSI